MFGLCCVTTYLQCQTLGGTSFCVGGYKNLFQVSTMTTKILSYPVSVCSEFSLPGYQRVRRLDFAWFSIEPHQEFGRLQKACEHLFRISTADRYAGNLKAERGLQQEGDYLSDFSHCYQPCSAHKVHSCMKASNLAFSDDVSGLLNCGLACQEIGATKTLRAILVSILQESLVISSAPAPGVQVQRFRQEAYDLYLPVTNAPKPLQRTNQKRRKILQYFLSSDLQESAKIVHHCSPQCCRSEGETRRAVTCCQSLCELGAHTLETSDFKSEILDRVPASALLGRRAAHPPQFVPKGHGRLFRSARRPTSRTAA